MPMTFEALVALYIAKEDAALKLDSIGEGSFIDFLRSVNYEEIVKEDLAELEAQIKYDTAEKAYKNGLQEMLTAQ